MAAPTKRPAKAKAAPAKKAHAPAAPAPSFTHGKVHWNELNTHDVERAKRFYASSLGYTFDAMPMPGMTYWIIKSGPETVGGLFEMSGPDFKGVPEHWLIYISVDDIDARVAKAKKAGGKLTRPIFDIPGVGRIAIIEQPGGGMIGWMTPASM